jgi:hypothetical protein
MNRTLWSSTLSEHHSPAWPCPVCTKGTLALVPKSLIFKETVQSKREHDEDYWSRDLVNYVFTAWLKCGHPYCGQEVSVSGIGGVEQWQVLDEDSEPEIMHSNYFVPRFLSPMPNIFDLPKKCPDEVKIHLRAGFKLFFSDQSAAANRIRVALENLLDHLNVPRRRKNQNSKFSNLSLHERIEIFIREEPSLGGQLMALKWLGNTASHEADVSRDDLLDAFEILEHILDELIGQRSARVAELARKLTKKHAKKK